MSDALAPALPQPLWPQPIPIIGGTGLPGSGKTRFGLSICPGPKTLCYDLEQSSASYTYIGFDRVDVQKEMQKWCDAQTPRRQGYTAKELWVWWLAHIRSVPANKYDVIMIDPVTDLERGLVDWVDANPSYFGHTSGQYASMSGIKWGDVKDYEKMILADICAKCQTLYFTAHLGAVWGSDKKPTGAMKAKGKESLFQLASLYLWFTREPNAQGIKSGPPAAIVTKGRLEVGEVIDGEVVSYEVLPPRIPTATPKAIRDYFKNPAGKKGLVEAEKVKPETLSADDRLKLEVAKAEAERDAAQARAATVAAAQVMVANLPPEETTDEQKELEAAFAKEIANAVTPEDMGAIPPKIAAARDAGHVLPGQVAHLRNLYGARLTQLKAAAQPAA